MILRLMFAGSIAFIGTWLTCVYLGGPFEEARGAAFVLDLTGAVVAAALVSTWKVSLSVRMVPAVVAVICGAFMTIAGAFGHAALALSIFIGCTAGFGVAEIAERLPQRR